MQTRAPPAAPRQAIRFPGGPPQGQERKPCNPSPGYGAIALAHRTRDIRLLLDWFFTKNRSRMAGANTAQMFFADPGIEDLSATPFMTKPLRAAVQRHHIHAAGHATNELIANPLRRPSADARRFLMDVQLPTHAPVGHAIQAPA